jgi:DNA gyrase/topoisomerase IV subunit B
MVLGAPLACRRVHGAIDVEVALNWRLGKSSVHVVSFVNVERTLSGGSHEAGLRDALIRIFPDKSGPSLLDGTVAAIQVKLANPQFDRPTRSELETPEARTAVREVVGTYVRFQLETRPDLVLALRDRVKND